MKYFEMELDDCWNFTTLTNNHPLVTAASSYCLNNDQSTLFLFGGFNEEHTVTNTLSIINTCDFSIEQSIPLPIEGRLNAEMYFWNNSIILVGGVSFDHTKPMKLFTEILIIELPDYSIRKIELKQMGLRFNSFFDYTQGDLYYAGGLNTDNTIYKVSIPSKKIDEIKEDIYFSRCGSASISFGEGAILFSGFRREGNNPICYSDYYVYSFRDGKITHNQCNEFAGRTFSKPVLLKKYNKILFLLGTYNGMEASHSGVYYDYENDRFDGLLMQEIPVGLTEAVVFYLENKNTVYIAGGITNEKVQNILWELDVGKIKNIED